MDVNINELLEKFMTGKPPQLVSLVIKEPDAYEKSCPKTIEFRWRDNVETCLKFMPYITIIVLVMTLMILFLFKGCGSNGSVGTAEKPIQGVINAEVKASTSVQVVPRVNNGMKD